MGITELAKVTNTCGRPAV